MLLDAKHKPWIFVVSGLFVACTAVYVPYHVLSLNGPSGGSWVGLAFGIAALALMLFAGLLGARRRFPAVRLGRPETWMRAHLWLGLLTVPLVFFHAGFRLGGALTLALLILTLLVTISGTFGLVLQQILPRVMTARLPMETIYEQIDHVGQQLVVEADTLVGAVAGPVGTWALPAVASAKAGLPAVASAKAGLPAEVAAKATVPASVPAEAPPPARPPEERPAKPLSTKIEAPKEGSMPLRDFYTNHVRPFLESDGRGAFSDPTRAGGAFTSVRALLPPTLHETLKDLEVMCEERRQLATQARFHRWLHGWLLVHIPLSYGLLLLAGVHAYQSVKY
jgi:hypothetical protein